MDDEENCVRERNRESSCRKNGFRECWIGAWKGGTSGGETSDDIADEEFFLWKWSL